MSDIKAGDLVIVVRPNGCRKCKQKSLGRIFKVELIDGPYSNAICNCGAVTEQGSSMRAVSPDRLRYDLSRLKKIPPLTEPESTNHRETEKA